MKFFVATQLIQAQAPGNEAVLIAGDFNIDRNATYPGNSSPITGSDCSPSTVCESRCGIVSCTTWDGAQGPLTEQVQCGACPAMSGQQEFERMLTVLPIEQPDRVPAVGDTQPKSNRQGKWLDYVFFNTDYLHPLNATNTVLRVRDERSLYKFDDLSDHFAVQGIYHFPPQ
jgi:hypothetical protein